jgi:hypothetical protein
MADGTGSAPAMSPIAALTRGPASSCRALRVSKMVCCAFPGRLGEIADAGLQDRAHVRQNRVVPHRADLGVHFGGAEVGLAQVRREDARNTRAASRRQIAGRGRRHAGRRHRAFEAGHRGKGGSPIERRRVLRGEGHARIKWRLACCYVTGKFECTGSVESQLRPREAQRAGLLIPDQRRQLPTALIRPGSRSSV